MPARNAKVFFFLCVLLGLGAAFATPQDSLYEKALDAESDGDVATAIHLFEMANSFPGNYNAEIQEILAEYYDALQIERDSGGGTELSFWVNLEASGSRYDELENSRGVHEFFGEGVLRFGAELFIPQGALSHRVAFLFDAAAFSYEPNTAFDTNRVELSPSVEYSLLGKRFAVSLETGLLFSERDKGVFFAFFRGTRDFYRNGDSRAGFRGDFYGNSLDRVRISAGGFFEIRRERGVSVELDLSGRFDGDTSVSAYFTYPLENFENGEPFPWDADAGFLPDSVSERYYLGRRSKLGPEFCAFLEYRFSRLFALDFRGNLFFSYGPQKDRWLREAGRSASWNRLMLQGFFALRANLDWERFGTYFSVENYFYRYFQLPNDHPGIFSASALQEKVRLGGVFRF